MCASLHEPHAQCFEWIEYFAGSSRCTSKVRLKGYTGARFDKVYHTPSPDRPHSSNFMDINSPSGFVLAIVALLKCKPQAFAIWLGIKCSSWTSINRGTSKRCRESRLVDGSLRRIYPMPFADAVANIFDDLRLQANHVKGMELPEQLLADEQAILKKIKMLEVSITDDEQVLSVSPAVGRGSTETLTEAELAEMHACVPEDEQETGKTVEPSETDVAEKPCGSRRPLKRKRVKTRRELLQEAAKARIARMTKPKRKRTDLNVPQFVIDKWNSGTSSKDEMAELLMRVNNDKDKFVEELELIIRKVKKFILHVNEGWYSESEMKAELKWSAQRIAGAKKLCEANPDLNRTSYAAIS
ncbi:unnamed protein product [Symbiodinium necroappetens]|uniref:Uncharacterized protein n=1 Tax=Symbiodinium necroappetens TaxID=1628268 RepID=A0A812M8A4_9DINO|nr:unnamed protein product [Symbiodinium necroappetens]